jgi:hypothetical protein
MQCDEKLGQKGGIQQLTQLHEALELDFRPAFISVLQKELVCVIYGAVSHIAVQSRRTKAKQNQNLKHLSFPHNICQALE